MGDTQRIDRLRELALSSMPSLARRLPPRRRSSGSMEIFQEQKSSGSALRVIQDDEKEEGELSSSDDEADRSATPLDTVELSSSLSHRAAALSLPAQTEENLKDERLTSAVIVAESVPLIGVPSASAVSTTRGSIVNKSQVFSAFTAQAVNNLSDMGKVAKQPQYILPKVSSFGGSPKHFVPCAYAGALGNTAMSTATSQLISTSLDPARPQASGNAPCYETTSQTSSLDGATLSPTLGPVPSFTCPSPKCPDPPRAVSTVARPVSVPVSVTSAGGADVSSSLGTAAASSVFETLVVGGVGVRKEAEAFLASLRIPLTNSAGSVAEKGDAFLINFDEDSESDFENEHSTNPILRHRESRSQKGMDSSAGPVATSVPLQPNPVIPTQSPADLTAEIDRMKKQIAAMERTKGKISTPHVLGKSSKVLSTGTTRNMSTAPAEPKVGTYSAVNVRPASIDLESMRLKIAAKESELHQRRQRLAVKLPDSNRGVSDQKRTGGVDASYIPPISRLSQTADSAAAHAGNLLGKGLSGKGSSGSKKEVCTRADGVPALALAGPAGSNLAGFKKDAEQRGFDGANDQEYLHCPATNLTAVRSDVSRVPEQQPVLKGTKRSVAEGENCELFKVPKYDDDFVSQKSTPGDSLKEVVLMRNVIDHLKHGSSTLSSVKTSKRKVDSVQNPYEKVMPGSPVRYFSAPVSEAMKKSKTNSGAGLIKSSLYPREELVPGLVPSIKQHMQIKKGEHLEGLALQRNSDNVQKLGTTGNPEGLQIRQASCGLGICYVSPQTLGDSACNASVTQPVDKIRADKQTKAHKTASGTEGHQDIPDRVNLKSAVSAENNKIHSALPWKSDNPVSQANLDFGVEHSFHPGRSMTDHKQLDREHYNFEQLLKEEELLDKQLEEVQLIRQQCEVIERVARREYREAQSALRAANAQCDALSQRKEYLLSQIHAAEGRNLSVKSYIEQPLVPLGGTLVTYNPIRPERPPLLVSAPFSLSQAGKGSWEMDANADLDHSARVHESLSPFSSNRVDFAAVGRRDAKSFASVEEGEENSCYKLVKSGSSDDKEPDADGQLIAGVESTRILENQIGGEKRLQCGFDTVERHEDLDPGIVDSASQSENQCCSDMNNNGSDIRPSLGSENIIAGVPKVSIIGQNRASMRRFTSDTMADEQVPIKSFSCAKIECPKQFAALCSIDDSITSSPRMGELFFAHTVHERHPLPAQHVLPRLDFPLLMGGGLEHQHSDKKDHDDNHLSVSITSQDVQSVDSLRIDKAQAEDLNAARELDVKLAIIDTIQDDSTEKCLARICEEVAIPTHFKDCSMGITDSCTQAGIQDVSNGSKSKEGSGWVLPEKLSSVQAAEFLDNRTKVMEPFAISGKYVEDVPLHPDGELQCPVPHMLESSWAEDETKRWNSESLVEVSGNTFVLKTQPQERSSHQPLLGRDPICENETNPCDGDHTQINNPDVALSNVEQVGATIIWNSCDTEAGRHANAADQNTQVSESSEEQVSASLLQSVGCTDDPIVMDLEIQHSKDVESSEGALGVHLAEKVEYVTMVSCREDLLAHRSENYPVNVAEDLDCVLLSAQQGISGTESMDHISGNFLTETTSKHVCCNTSILQLHCQTPPQEGDAQCDNSFPNKLTDLRNLNNIGPQGCARILEEQRRSASELCHQPALNISFNGSSIPENFGDKKGDHIQYGDRNICRVIDLEIKSKHAEAYIEKELGSHEQNLGMDLHPEDQQWDQLNEEISKSGEAKQEDPEKKEIQGAEVEVFRKAPLDGSVFERTSSSGKISDTANVINQKTDDVSEQILPQLQKLRLEHLDMVQVRVPESSKGGNTEIGGDLQRLKSMGCSIANDDMQLDLGNFEVYDVVVHRSEQTPVSEDGQVAPSSCTELRNVGDRRSYWFPSADSSAVLRFIPKALVAHAESDTVGGVERVLSQGGLPASFGTGVIPFRYESPLSMFRSYRICPQFSDKLYLSYSSITWSHAINPFKPLCKFEHRGKCNNDDCQWQHTIDYALSSSQVVSQIQNYVAPLQLNFEDVAITGIDEGRRMTMAYVPLPTGDRSISAVIAQAGLHSFRGPVSSSLKWNDSEVPIYFTGPYTLRTEDIMRPGLLSQSLQLDRKVCSPRSFLLSLSIHRPLPADMPCLLNASETPSWFVEDSAYHPGSPHWRYMREIQERLTYTKDGGELQELIDEEMWLELALHHIDYDISNDSRKARDQALFYLSRALESKQSSVSLWVVYSCLFHTWRYNPEEDDMFHHAVQYNPRSYELWVLYINSRSDLQLRLEAYEKAIVALAKEGTQLHLDAEERSACILDLGLQLLYCWCVSGCYEDSYVWIYDLVCEASAQDEVRPLRASTAAILSHLTQHDACILWIACTYLSACKKLPDSITARLGCKQELPRCLEWEKHANLDEVSHKRVMKALSTAASEGIGCLSLGTAPAVADTQDFAKQVLGVNYIHCLALYEGLISASSMGKKLISLHPFSLELIIVCARIDERCKSFIEGLHVFEKALFQWPQGCPGVQRLWNQYAGHALLWGGKDLAETVLLKCIAIRKLPSIQGEEVLQRISVEKPVIIMSLGNTERTDCKGRTVAGWSRLREYFALLTSVCKRVEGGYHISEIEDLVYGLINLALVEALSGDMTASHSAINSAMKAAISHNGLRYFWRELATFQQTFGGMSAGWGNSKMFDYSILSLLDRCKTDSHNSLELRPLFQKAFQKYKKPHVCKFLNSLMGSAADHSVLNSILHTLYGPQLLPCGSHSLKEMFHFAEGILEAVPGNVQLASCLCKIVHKTRNTLKQMYRSAVMWASGLLMSSLQQCCPDAPEFYWIEAGLLLRQLDEERSLQEFYTLSLVKYPFSDALRHCLAELEGQQHVSDVSPVDAKHKSLELVTAEPLQVTVEC